MFPQQVERLIEPQRAPIADAVRVHRPDRASENVCGDGDRPPGGGHLHVDTGPGPERTWGLDERSAGAQVHDRHRAARAERGAHAHNRGVTESGVAAAFD